MKAHVVKGDLLSQQVDAIVNSWNRNVIPWWLLLPQGVSKAIKKKAGIAPFVELGKKGPIKLGQAVLTTPGNLDVKGIIHVAGIDLMWRASEESIRNSIASAIKLAEKEFFESIAFPIIGSGVGGFGSADALDIMLKEFRTIDSRIEAVVVKFYRKS